MSTVRWRTSLRSCSMSRRIWLALCFKAVWRYLSLLKHRFRVQFHSLTFWVLMDKTRVFPLSHLTWWRQSLTTQRISSAHVKRKDSTSNTIMLISQIQKLKTLQINQTKQTKSKSTLIKRWRNPIPLMAISLSLHYNSRCMAATILFRQTKLLRGIQVWKMCHVHTAVKLAKHQPSMETLDSLMDLSQVWYLPFTQFLLSLRFSIKFIIASSKNQESLRITNKFLNQMRDNRLKITRQKSIKRFQARILINLHSEKNNKIVYKMNIKIYIYQKYI